jgi:hypothetical protein
MRCSKKIVKPQNQADTPCTRNVALVNAGCRRPSLCSTVRGSAATTEADDHCQHQCMPARPVNWGAEKKRSWTSRKRFGYFCHLSCVPKKGDKKKGTRRKFLTPCSVVLGTFRKLTLRPQTVRNALPLDSLAWLTFRMGVSGFKSLFGVVRQARFHRNLLYTLMS